MATRIPAASMPLRSSATADRDRSGHEQDAQIDGIQADLLPDPGPVLHAHRPPMISLKKDTGMQLSLMASSSTLTPETHRLRGTERRVRQPLRSGCRASGASHHPRSVRPGVGAVASRSGTHRSIARAVASPGGAG